MESNIVGLFASYLLIGAFLAISMVLNKLKYNPEFVRKVVHIGVSNWWLVNIHFFTEFKYAIIPPITFIILNSIATFSDVAAKQFNQKDIYRNLGLVYFPISLIIAIVSYTYGYSSKVASGVAILSMGYGDGLAGIIGRRYGRKKIFTNKSYVGGLTMFTVTFLISLFFPIFYDFWALNFNSFVKSIIVGLTGFCAELVPHIDNLTVPILILVVFQIMTNKH